MKRFIQKSLAFSGFKKSEVIDSFYRKRSLGAPDLYKIPKQNNNNNLSDLQVFPKSREFLNEYVV